MHVYTEVGQLSLMIVAWQPNPMLDCVVIDSDWIGSSLILYCCKMAVMECFIGSHFSSTVARGGSTSFYCQTLPQPL